MASDEGDVIAIDDPDAADVRALLLPHLAFAAEHTLPEDVYALSIDGSSIPASRCSAFGAAKGVGRRGGAPPQRSTPPTGRSTIVEQVVVGFAGMGERVRALRRARGWSLDAVARRSGVSRSMISEIERGGRAPTVLVLDRVATALGTSIARLIRPVSRHAPVVLRRVEQDVLVDPAGWQRRILSPVLAGVEFEFMRTTLGAAVDAGQFLPHAPGSREYLAVERGTLELELDGQVQCLEEGDSIFYPGDCRHGFRNPRRAVCVYYLAMDVAGGHLIVTDSIRPPGEHTTPDGRDPS